ncbi:MAG: hypothetical protein ACLQGT_10745, partial [Terracidiphilus sp.]
ILTPCSFTRCLPFAIPITGGMPDAGRHREILRLLENAQAVKSAKNRRDQSMLAIALASAFISRSRPGGPLPARPDVLHLIDTQRASPEYHLQECALAGFNASCIVIRKVSLETLSTY